jgi:hypothetical protein
VSLLHTGGGCSRQFLERPATVDGDFSSCVKSLSSLAKTPLGPRFPQAHPSVSTKIHKRKKGNGFFHYFERPEIKTCFAKNKM